MEKIAIVVQQFWQFLRDLFNSREIILELAKKDFKTKYFGSYFGILWAFVQPAITILIFYFVFQIGFKSQPVGNFPFILWFMAGFTPWLFFSDSLANAAYSVTENSFLVKKVVFRVSILPIVKIGSSLMIHLFFIGVLFFMFIFHGYSPDRYNLQVLYYLFSSVVLILGLSWITSSVIIFFKDLGQVIGMMLQFGFWLTPVFWSLDIIPDRYTTLLKLNPAFYLVEGYRDCFIHKMWFWNHGILTAYYWSVTVLIFIAGALIFRKLRPHFADVL